jgi:hypothetical protein
MILKDALAMMNAKEEPFDIEFSTLKGEIIKMANCMLAGSQHDMNKHRTITVKCLDSQQIRTVKIYSGIRYVNGEKVHF